MSKLTIPNSKRRTKVTQDNMEVAVIALSIKFSKFQTRTSFKALAKKRIQRKILRDVYDDILVKECGWVDGGPNNPNFAGFVAITHKIVGTGNANYHANIGNIEYQVGIELAKELEFIK